MTVVSGLVSVLTGYLERLRDGDLCVTHFLSNHLGIAWTRSLGCSRSGERRERRILSFVTAGGFER